MTDIIIIGAGCAGLTAAIYAARDKKSVLIYENESVGGQISRSPKVENYPGIKDISGMEFSDILCEQALGFGAQMDYGKVLKIEKSADGFEVYTDDGKTHPCKSVILATGARHSKLGIDREDEMTGKGVSYCAICDGAFYKEKEVALVGGGNTALQSAELLADICSKVYLIHRRDSFRGEAEMAKRVAANPKVELVLDSEVVKINGEQTLSSVTVRNKKTGDEKNIDVKGMFIAIGQKPDNAAFTNLVDCDADGYIIADESCKTSCEGIYAAGDCRTKSVRQLTTAASDGAVAALSAGAYIRSK